MQPENIIILGMEVHSLRLIKQLFLVIINNEIRLNLVISEYFNINSPIIYPIIPVCHLTFS